MKTAITNFRTKNESLPSVSGVGAAGAGATAGGVVVVVVDGPAVDADAVALDDRGVVLEPVALTLGVAG